MHTEIDVENLDGTLVEGMYAETTLVLQQKDNALTVPTEGIQRNGSNGTVFVVNRKASSNSARSHWASIAGSVSRCSPGSAMGSELSWEI